MHLKAGPESSEREFGIVWLSDEELKPVGCACEIEKVLERMDDGRLNILARGTRPFRLVERQDDLPYPAGMVEFLTEEVEEIDPQAARSARELYGELVEQATDQRLEEDELSNMDAYGWPPLWSSGPTPSRSCSSCDRRTPACAC